MQHVAKRSKPSNHLPEKNNNFSIFSNQEDASVWIRTSQMARARAFPASLRRANPKAGNTEQLGDPWPYPVAASSGARRTRAGDTGKAKGGFLSSERKRRGLSLVIHIYIYMYTRMMGQDSPGSWTAWCSPCFPMKFPDLRFFRFRRLVWLGFPVAS